MDIFKFTKYRKRLFLILSVLFIGIPLLATFDILIERQLETMSLLNDISFLIVMIFFWTPALIFGNVLKIPYFEFGIGAGPTNIAGFILTILFWYILIFLLTWPGNKKID
jgi:hypothetical protein